MQIKATKTPARIFAVIKLFTYLSGAGNVGTGHISMQIFLKMMLSNKGEEKMLFTCLTLSYSEYDLNLVNTRILLCM